MNDEDEDVLRADELDVVGEQFGIVIVKRPKGQSDIIKLYSEDDENYHYVQTFAAFWLADLIKVAEQARTQADCEVEFQR